uniref:Uncharacterized protein n=1 Tax=Oryza meridionalis TaxID=40149 RepID=A0A0E0ETY4_9ORYZ
MVPLPSRSPSLISAHGPSVLLPWRSVAKWSSSATRSHTKLFALRPLPTASCHTVSPRRTLPFASMYASWYHSDAADWFPNRWNAISAASISASPSPSPCPSLQIIGLPDDGRQKCSAAALKSGIGTELAFLSWRWRSSAAT